MDELALLELPVVQLRVFLAMRHLEDRWGGLKASMDDLAELTGYSRSALSRAVSGLADNGWVRIVRTKRNYGLLSVNSYEILRCSRRKTSEDDGCASGETSTRSHVTIKSTNTVKSTNQVKPISKLHKLHPADAMGEKKEFVVINRWEDDDIGGFGLLDGEVSGLVPKATKGKIHREQKPIEKWTSADVASEFAARIYAKVRGIPGLINTRNLAMALASNRKKHGVTAVQEMAAMEKFFGDERNFTTIRKFPKNAHGMFLNAITHYLASAPVAASGPQPEKYVYASDGTKFDNSMFGRLELQEYESSLKG